AEYAELFAHPYRAAARGYVDEVIVPSNTRSRLIKGFAMLENKTVRRPRRKHGNLPL
ncbi:MAG: carboxyl transferase domain-containing protein, partial [Flavobacteriales bacterium]